MRTNNLVVRTELYGQSMAMTVSQNNGNQEGTILVSETKDTTGTDEVGYEALQKIVEAQTTAAANAIKKQVMSVVPVIFGLIGFYVVISKAEQKLASMKKK